MSEKIASDLWRPLWRTHTERPRPALAGRHDTEIAIVGAGLEGLSLAGELARCKKTVVVVEAGRIGQGATGASAGIIAPQLVRATPDDVVRHLGRPQAELFLRLLAEAGKRTFELLGSRKGEAAASNGGFIAPAKGAAGAQRTFRTVEQWKPFRSDLKVLSAQETRALTGATGYSTALLDPSGGSLNPVAYAEFLAVSAEDAGAVIYLQTPITTLEQAGSAWRLVAECGTITARQVILCANGGNSLLAPALRRSVLPLSVCQVATEPLDAAMRQAILPQGHAMTDVENDVFSIRFDPDGRLITAYPMSDRLREPGRLTELVNRRLTAMLPAYRPMPLEYAWTGIAWLNSDLLPRIVPLAEGAFAVQACNGRGIALSTAIGHAFAKWLVDGASGPCPVPVQQPRAVPGYTFARYLPALLMKMSLVAKRLRRAVSR